jgi:hypothetical protein
MERKYTNTKCIQGAFFAAMLFVVQFSLAQSEYRFQHFTTKDGLADDFAWTIKQDSLGYIWIQYYGGLTRFDGHNFKVYKYDKDDSRRSSLDFLVGGLSQDKQKNIWVTQHGHPQRPPLTLARYDRKTDGFVKSRFR